MLSQKYYKLVQGKMLRQNPYFFESLKDMVRSYLTPEDAIAIDIGNFDFKFTGLIVGFEYGKIYQSTMMIVNVSKDLMIFNGEYIAKTNDFSFYVHEGKPYVTIYGIPCELFGVWD